MAVKERKDGAKKAIVNIDRPEGFVGPDDKKPNVITFFMEGKRYDIAVRKFVTVPLALAQDMKAKGYISDYVEA